MSTTRRWISVLAALIVLPLTLSADTLYLRNGSRIQGELVSVRSGTVEFRERRGFGSRVVTYDRDEVDRIEFERASSSSGSSNSNERPFGLRERTVVVSADVAWNDAGIDVRPGQTIYFEATGQVRWGGNRRDGPAGERNSPESPLRPMPSRPGGSLIGKVGSDSSDLFFIGDEKGPIRVRSSGRLYLGINDQFLQDNSGNFRVTVYY
jgi:hypothetical protein